MKRSIVFLLGFMGCGKSTIGPLVARAFDYRFVDLDDEIERRSERNIATLFNELGESGFREIETRELRRVAVMQDAIVACGGGVATLEENRRLIAQNGISIYIRVDADALALRLRSSLDRPMLYGDDGQRLSPTELTTRIEQLLAAREPYYERADAVVDVTELSVRDAASVVTNAVSGLFDLRSDAR